YAEPAEYVYVAPPERVVVVTREVLVQRGWVVYRVQQSGPNRVIWARRGPDEIVRIFVTPQGDRVAVRGVWEARDRGRHRGWERRGLRERRSVALPFAAERRSSGDRRVRADRRLALRRSLVVRRLLPDRRHKAVASPPR